MNSYRPISNLPFISKLLERYVARCLLDHMTANNLLERHQSAYKSHHSTESALVLVQNDILGALDRRFGVILVLLDMSAAFDTVNHEILLNRLEHRYGMAGSVLAWMRSYLTDRSQCVYLQGSASSNSGVACGVPQGSVLGPLLFSAYTAPIGDIIRRHTLGFHLYADDTQLYIKFEMTEINRLLSLRRIEQCLNDIRAWMGDNQLKVNDDKTVALVLSSRNNRANHNITVIKIGDCDITPSPTGRNIGVIFDTEMSMVSHVKHVCCISYYHLRNIASIRSCLTQKAAVRLVYSLVISRIDYANCLLYDLPQCLISKLQRVQNAAARLVVRCHRCEHITPVLMKLHWLPVKQRVQYSILLLVFRAQHRLAPPYITDLLEQRATRV